ncbi:hypothetical protein GCM10009678_50660 [Actinomadura kijaniata]|uniref:Putative flippase GtrA n=1 Tax=Actinomadura namibiensis TaxID=182080 RepID=A0A7W3LI86_ACTNM|nr:hypothetical protein [Actinomadura namibiensis]MBA8948564.1 putative flippase GtrA [Actinomadura namibiensis]
MTGERARTSPSAGTTAGPVAERRGAARFLRYSSLSLVTVPCGYGLLLLARHWWDVNAGLLNLAVGTVLTPPSFLLYRTLVWREGSGRGLLRELFGFWQTVMLGALAAGVFIGLGDVLFGGDPVLIVVSGLTGQVLIFLARYLWLDRVTFARRGAGRRSGPLGPISDPKAQETAIDD